jgi:hypothetical protein
MSVANVFDRFSFSFLALTLLLVEVFRIAGSYRNTFVVRQRKNVVIQCYFFCTFCVFYLGCVGRNQNTVSSIFMGDLTHED